MDSMISQKNRIPELIPCVSGPACERGFALLTTLVIVIIVGILAISGLRTTELTEILSGNSIQRGRAFNAAQGALIEAERTIADSVGQRIFSSASASQGIFSNDAVDEQWWRAGDYVGALQVESGSYPGVVSSPIYVVEEIGNYQSDGGSGIISLDRGGAEYGGLTASGKEVVLYRLQTRGLGSTDSAQAVVESLYVERQ